MLRVSALLVLPAAALFVGGCAASAPPYYGPPYAGPYGAPQAPQTRVQGAEAVTPAAPGSSQMNFQPMQSVPAEYYYGPQDNGGVQPAGSATRQSPPSYPTPNQSGSNANHAPDYSWIRGRLEKSHIGGGAWIVRYASPSEEDPYGGAVVLQGVDPAQYGLKSGDYVIVRGSIAENTTFPYLPNPGYRVIEIRPAR